MNYLVRLIDHAIVDALGWTLLHFLWQGMIVGLAVAAALFVTRNRSASARYAVSCLALLLMVLAPVVTFVTTLEFTGSLSASAETEENLSDAASQELSDESRILAADADVLLNPEALNPHGARAPVLPLAPETRDASTLASIEPWLSLLVGIWLAGVTILATRLILTIAQVKRLATTGTSPVSDALLGQLNKIARRVRVTRPVRLVQSALVEVPTVIGHFRPMILLPVSALTGLTQEQLESIITHELAHIRRHDFLINLLQSVAETLLFYHPAVWWVSGRIRIERENCCDDIASHAFGDRVGYATALVRMEELRSPMNQLAMAATGGSLSSRIRRLLRKPPKEELLTDWWVSGAVSLLVVVAMVLVVAATSIDSQAAPARNDGAQSDTERTDTSNELTAADVAGHVQDALKNYSTIDFTAEWEETQNLVEALPKYEPVSTESRGHFRYRADGERFHAERTQTLSRRGNDGNSWIEGFDGNVHYHTNGGLLLFGEESLSGQALAAVNYFFSLTGHPEEFIRLLRHEDAELTSREQIDGVECLVIRLKRSRDEREWQYNFWIAPDRSWLPLRLERVENGAVKHRRQMYDLAQSGDRWYAKRVVTDRFSESTTFKSTVTSISTFDPRPEFDEDNFRPPVPFGTSVLDRRVGYGFHAEPWWPELKKWLQSEYNWPRPDLFAMHSIGHYGECRLAGKKAPPIEPAEWLTEDPGDWDRPDRKLTLLYFYGGRLISPTPLWATAIGELERRYKKFGFEVIALAAATDSPELPKHAARELGMRFSIGIDQKAESGYGKTFVAFGLDSYHGLMFVDHEGIVRPCTQGESSTVTLDDVDFTISHMEATVVDLLRKAGVPDVTPQLLPSDIFDIQTYNRVKQKWKQLRTKASARANVSGSVLFGSKPVSGSSVSLTPYLKLMTSNTGHGFTTMADGEGTIRGQTDADGRFEFSNVPKGAYQMSVSGEGHRTVEKTIYIGNEPDSLTVDIQLKPSGNGAGFFGFGSAP